MKIDGSVALVTGANRGLGQVYARELVGRGAGKVCGAARIPLPSRARRHAHCARQHRPGRVARATARRTDVTLLVNQRRGAEVQHLHRCA